MKKFDFLTSVRFWAMVITSGSVVLIDPAFPTQPWYISIGKFLGLVGAGFVTVGTVDRASEQKVVAAGVASGQVSTDDLKNIPPQS